MGGVNTSGLSHSAYPNRTYYGPSTGGTSSSYGMRRFYSP